MLPGETYSTAKVEAVTVVLIKIYLFLDVTQFRKVFLDCLTVTSQQDKTS